MAKKTKQKKRIKKKSDCGLTTSTTTTIGGRPVSTTKKIVNPGVNNQI